MSESDPISPQMARSLGAPLPPGVMPTAARSYEEIPDEKADFESAAKFMEGKVTGCGACGFTGGECFSQDPTTCPSAKMVAREREAAIPDLSKSVITLDEARKNLPPEQDEGGVWVTYGQAAQTVRVWASELDALRYALPNSQSAAFLGWGEEL